MRTLRLLCVSVRRSLPMAALTFACSDGTPAAALPTEGVAFVPACSGDNDGLIDVGELSFTPGVTAPYAVQRTGDTAVEVAGDAAAGSGLWDFSHARFEGLVEVPTLSPAGLWYADDFPTANLSIPFEAPGAPPGHLVLRATPEVLSILGVASVEPEQQRLVYSAGVPFMQFPMAVGDARSSAVTLAAGSVWQGYALDTLGVTDTYTMEVTGRGRLKLPGMSIDNVLALRLALDRHVPDQADSADKHAEQTYLIHECLGTVAVRAAAGGPWRVIWYPQ